MAKKIYNVTLTDGTQIECSTKKAVRALEAIAQVALNGQDVTAEFVKEEETMAQEIITNEYVEAVEAIEAVEEAQAEVEAIEEPAGPKNTILFIASRGKGTFLRWFQIPVTEADELVKVKGCAALVPTQVAEAIGTNKFVSWIDQAMIERSVAEAKPVRGMASTVSDVYARYIKVTELLGADKVNTALEVFAEVLNQIDEGHTEGGWERLPEEPEQGEEAPAAEIEAA